MRNCRRSDGDATALAKQSKGRLSNLPTEGTTESPLQTAARVSASSGHTTWPGRSEKTPNITQPRKRGKSPRTTHHTPRARASGQRNRTSVRTLTTSERRSHDVNRRCSKPFAAGDTEGTTTHPNGSRGGGLRACALRGRRSWCACALRSAPAASCRGNEEQV